jgi:hypothetical protein
MIRAEHGGAVPIILALEKVRQEVNSEPVCAT